MHPRVAGILALGLRPCLVGLLVASGPEQQIGDQRLRAGMIVELAAPAGGEGLAHRVDRLVEPAELLVDVGELVEIPRTVWLRVGQRERGGDQPRLSMVVIALAGGVQLAIDPLKIGHARRLARSLKPLLARGGVAATPNPVDVRSPSAAGRCERSRGSPTGRSPPCFRFPLRWLVCCPC